MTQVFHHLQLRKGWREMTLEEWAKSFGPGHFTCGAKYFCFLPESGDDVEYVKIAEIGPDMKADEDWHVFADALVDHLNALLQNNGEPASK